MKSFLLVQNLCHCRLQKNFACRSKIHIHRASSILSISAPPGVALYLFQFAQLLFPKEEKVKQGEAILKGAFITF